VASCSTKRRVAVRRSLLNQLFGITATAPTVLGAIAGMLALSGMAACAPRPTRIPPMMGLHSGQGAGGSRKFVMDLPPTCPPLRGGAKSDDLTRSVGLGEREAKIEDRKPTAVSPAVG
jgi:hypothetical protein